MPRHPELSLGILAGGAGRRVGGRDKGWIEIDGRPAIERLVDRFRGEVAEIVVSANRTLERYRALGLRVVGDTEPGHPGPLAGVVALLAATHTRWLLTLPVDLVAVPGDFLDRIAAALPAAGDADADRRVVVVHDDDGCQPLFAAYPRRLADEAQRAFAAGERSVMRWQAALATTALRLPGTLGNRNLPGPG